MKVFECEFLAEVSVMSVVYDYLVLLCSKGKRLIYTERPGYPPRPGMGSNSQPQDMHIRWTDFHKTNVMYLISFQVRRALQLYMASSRMRGCSRGRSPPWTTNMSSPGPSITSGIKMQKYEHLR